MPDTVVTDANTADQQVEETPVISNTVALIGLILAITGSGLCGALFLVAGSLPDSIVDFQQRLTSDTPVQMRVLILGSSAALLLMIAFVLCVVGLFLPNRSRVLAVVGTAISVLLLMGIFGVLVIGAIMTPQDNATQPAATSTSN